MSDERKRGGPIREDRDEFILKSLQASPDYEDIEGLRLRLMDEGWVEYPHDKLRGKLSTASLQASLRRLKRQHRLPKRPREVKRNAEDVANAVGPGPVTEVRVTMPIPGWAQDDAQRIRALVALGLRVRLVNGQWEVVP